MSGGSKRLTKELGELTANPPDHMQVSLWNDSDVHKWKVVVSPPESTPYHGGRFDITLTMPTEYPFKPPLVSFNTKIYHPNVSNDDKGLMCLGLLRADQWKPSTKLVEVLNFAMAIIITPDPDDAVEQSIAQEYKENTAYWEKTAREWTSRYAKP